MPDQSYAATEHALLEEITGPLQRLAEDPLELVEADFPAAMRGYDRAAVDDYVVSTRRLVAELHAVRSPESAVRRALVRAGGQISGVLRRAHETAAEITAKSRSEAEDRLERARVEADELIDGAQRRVRELDADTDRIWLDRQRIMADVEDLSDQLHGLAKQAGDRFPDDDGEPRAPIDPPPAMPEAGDEPAAWEQWADHDVPPATGSASDRPEADAGSAPRRLTDNDETLALDPPASLDLAAPPEVEPRSARLSSVDDAAGDEPDPGAGVIPPMSPAANRPRRS